jgi:hypothetical protein
MTNFWDITEEEWDSKPKRRQLHQWICDWELGRPLEPTTFIPPSPQSTVPPLPVPSSVSSTVAPSASYASAGARPWRAITSLSPLSSVPPTIAPSPAYPSTELPVTTAQPAQPNSESKLYGMAEHQKTDDAYLSKTTPHIGQEVIRSKDDYSESEPDPSGSGVFDPPCDRCTKIGVICRGASNPNVSTCANCHRQKKGCVRKGRVPSKQPTVSKKPVKDNEREPALEPAVIPAGKEGEYAGAYILYLV